MLLLVLGADNPSVGLAVLNSLSKQYVSRTLLRLGSSTKLENPSDRRFSPECYGPWYICSVLSPDKNWRQAKGESRNQRTEDLNTHSPRIACVESKESRWWRFRGLRCLKSVLLFYLVDQHRLFCASESIVLGCCATRWQALEYDSAGWPQHRQQDP